ncbi:MAG: tRNA preQ1(34) S-adenosylmethionine ribosyltransferase-isomerase QueA [Endomicrobiales bacterium]|nr:tRNA preQ1(34) S-adenosylmethionine ribosyltransferase-isomerase QueA [Endomicrobiales bacterium]
MIDPADLILDSYDYLLPPQLIAQKPAQKRDNSRLLVVNKTTGMLQHSHFSSIKDYFSKGDCLVLNKTKVFPARLKGKKESGGKAEALFLDFSAGTDGFFRALLKPSIDVGKTLHFNGGLKAKVAGKAENGEYLLEIKSENIINMLENFGEMPLPPYIKRKDAIATDVCDKDRYQTVYASVCGSIAAPTAGLHFTKLLIDEIKQHGVKVVEIVLHVGWGTFKPVVTNNVREHKMLPEYAEISTQSAQEINSSKNLGGRVFSVGTTATRALESFCNEQGVVVAGNKKTDLFIFPGYKFKCADALITNFHLPASTPMFLASAFLGRQKLLAAYKSAIEEKYRFYSYGDAMLIV